MRLARYTLLFLFSIISTAYAQSYNFSLANYTHDYANQTINQTLGYVNTINQSGYLIFYTNLTRAYSYLTKAQQIQGVSPSLAVLYSNQAASEAQKQYLQMSTYRLVSFFIMLILSALALVWLYLLMRGSVK